MAKWWVSSNARGLLPTSCDLEEFCGGNSFGVEIRRSKESLPAKVYTEGKQNEGWQQAQGEVQES